jgi:hypothetical protein
MAANSAQQIRNWNLDKFSTQNWIEANSMHTSPGSVMPQLEGAVALGSSQGARPRAPVQHHVGSLLLRVGLQSSISVCLSAPVWKWASHGLDFGIFRAVPMGGGTGAWAGLCRSGLRPIIFSSLQRDLDLDLPGRSAMMSWAMIWSSSPVPANGHWIK